MNHCPRCEANLSEGTRFCPNCGGAVDSLRLEINRNRLYMKNRSGVLEVRFSNPDTTESLPVTFVLESSDPARAQEFAYLQGSHRSNTVR
jgi:hypothetical protein